MSFFFQGPPDDTPGTPTGLLQAMIPHIGNQSMIDHISGTEFALASLVSAVDDDGTPAAVFPGTWSDNAATVISIPGGTEEMPIQSYTGGFTILVRGYGAAGELKTNVGSLFGDGGDSGTRGLMAGPGHNTANAYIPLSSTDLLAAGSVTAADFFTNYGPYRDYSLVFNPSTLWSWYSGADVISQESVGVPAQRYSGKHRNFLLGNRGDLTAGSASSFLNGRIQFFYLFDYAMSASQRAAFFADPWTNPDYSE